MNRKILLSALTATAIISANAQTRVGYAITGSSNKDFNWMNIVEVDLNKGTTDRVLFEKAKTDYTLTNATTKQTVDKSAILNGNIYSDRNYPTANMVAAAAYDRKSGKLFFVPMRSNELRWVDMDSKKSTKQFFTLQSEEIATSTNYNEENNITRMAIGADGYGYAISNDGQHLYQFTTGKNPSIKNLGALIDDEANKTASIHNKCSSWGGDMVGVSNGKLLIVTAQKLVFEVDVNSRIATMVGSIQGLPQNFTTNGVAVDDENNLVVASATGFDGLYRVDAETFAATKIVNSEANLSISDLAGANLLQARGTATAPVFADAKITSTKIFPNPVTNGTFRVELNGLAAGQYNLLITDLSGKTIQTDKLKITITQNFANVKMASKPAAGLYMVKVVTPDNKVVFTDKLVLQ